MSRILLPVLLIIISLVGLGRLVVNVRAQRANLAPTTAVRMPKP